VTARFRLSTLLLLLAFASAARAGDGTAWLSAKWLPMTAENERAYQEAETRYAAAARQAAQARKHKGGKLPTQAGVIVGTGIGSAGESSMGTMGVPGMDPNEADRRARRVGSDGDDTPAALDKLLPPALDFAAPKVDALIVQRTTSSVLFGRAGKEELVFLPLFGQADLAKGARATLREEAERMQVTVISAAGQKVEFSYRRQSAGSDQVLAVDVRLSDIPGGALEFTRLYRRAPGG
jgi:hypothetical protein